MWFDRVYAYLRVILRDSHAAEDAAQEVFTRAYTALPRYRRSTAPVCAWLFRIARNHALDRMRVAGFEPLPDELSEVHIDSQPGSGWPSDDDLRMFIERLPLAQRQVLGLRFMLNLSTADVATILERTPVDVRALQSRALRYLRERLGAVQAHQRQAFAR